MKKLFLIILILLVFYWISIFVAPEKTSKIEGMIWFWGITESVRWGKENFDSVITDIPSLNEVQSGAIDAKDKFLDWVDKTKQTIDTVRWGAQKVESTYNDAKETYEGAKETFDQTKETLNQLWEKVEQVQWVVEWVQKITWGWVE